MRADAAGQALGPCLAAAETVLASLAQEPVEARAAAVPADGRRHLRSVQDGAAPTA
ncbi:hypothetical protein MES4922_30147 [Mesorhizobium ventifaucium]|uniref:Uncharacterized protein n=1 Tax=Mesorhizobium ventifaucium TaxID=666020 RepID=A0ABN8JVN9_9HYPH|nr:hypothetical protein MES4922_30147 [Mesorhizobium ventifaucium]